MKHSNTILLALMVGLSIFLIASAPYGTIVSLHHNYVTLPPFKDRGVETVAVIVDIVPNSSSPKDYGRKVIVEHRPSHAARSYRNWLKSPLTERLIHDPKKGTWLLGYEARYGKRTTALRKVGDKIEIIYLQGDYEGRAVLKGDFDLNEQALASGPLALAILWGMLFLSLFVTRSLIRREVASQ